MRARAIPVVATVLGVCAWLGGCGSGPSHLSQEGPHGPECAAIQSAEQVGFSGDRAQALKKIAADPQLSEHEQEYLIDVATGSGGFSSDKADVLVTLAGNPAMTQRAREHVAERLRRAGLFSSDQERVTEALARR